MRRSLSIRGRHFLASAAKETWYVAAGRRRSRAIFTGRSLARLIRAQALIPHFGGKDHYMDQSATSLTQLAENSQIAARLRAFAELLASQGEDGFRVRAYRAAADKIETLDRPLRSVYEEGGLSALIALPKIGEGIAGAIIEMLTTGRWFQLERLRGEATADALFRTIPGIGPRLAERFATVLDAQTLEELETQLRNPAVLVPGVGARRRRAILAGLEQRLAPIRRSRKSAQPQPQPPVSLLLEADAIYRRKAEAGELRQIAPRRFNPEGVAWLPILHLRRGDWHLTLLYSNSAQAHDLGRVRDWVVVYFHHGFGPESQSTIVTETHGPLGGHRVVRGREDDCARYYAGVGRTGEGRASPASVAGP